MGIKDKVSSIYMAGKMKGKLCFALHTAQQIVHKIIKTAMISVPSEIEMRGN